MDETVLLEIVMAARRNLSEFETDRNDDLAYVCQMMMHNSHYVICFFGSKRYYPGPGLICHSSHSQSCIRCTLESSHFQQQVCFSMLSCSVGFVHIEKSVGVYVCLFLLLSPDSYTAHVLLD